MGSRYGICRGPEIRQAIIDQVNREDTGLYGSFLITVTMKRSLNGAKTGMTGHLTRMSWSFSGRVIPALYQLVEDLVAKDEKV